MFLSIFIQSNKLFQTITQSFYIASSHINIRTRNKLSAGGGHPRIFEIFWKSHSTENCRTVPKMSHSISLYIETNKRMLLPILIH